MSLINRSGATNDRGKSCFLKLARFCGISYPGANSVSRQILSKFQGGTLCYFLKWGCIGQDRCFYISILMNRLHIWQNNLLAKYLKFFKNAQGVFSGNDAYIPEKFALT